MSVYDFKNRILACENCTAPIKVPKAGGDIICSECGEVSAFGPQPKLKPLKFQKKKSIPEDQRIERLRAQDGKPLLAPEGLKGVIEDNEIPEWKLEEAKSVWLSLKKKVAEDNDFAAAESLFFLTFVFNNLYKDSEDAKRKRALNESALEAFSLPRHKQLMMCQLGGEAAKEGDVKSAKLWLKNCDPLADDIQADSYYRYAMALVATRNKNWSGVIKHLGSAYDEIPIMDAYDGVCVVLRANALEKQGNVEGAKEELMRYMNACGASGQSLVARIIDNYDFFDPCPQSFAQADEAYNKKAASSMGGMLGVGIMLMGSAGVMAAIGLVGIIAFAAKLSLPMFGQPSVDDIVGMVVMTGMAGLPFFFGLSMFMGAKKKQRLRLHGIRGRGKIISLKPTGTRINKVPQYELHIMVKADNIQPYEAKTKILIRAVEAGAFQPNQVVPLRIDPDKPQDVMVETA